MRIVIIDDESDIGFILSFELKAKGFTPIVFHSIDEALDYFKTESADAIICDYQMPKLNGLEFFRLLQSQGKQFPFYILTGESSMDKSEFTSQGITDVLFKPQDFARISDLLKKLASGQP